MFDWALSAGRKNVTSENFITSDDIEKSNSNRHNHWSSHSLSLSLSQSLSLPIQLPLSITQKHHLSPCRRAGCTLSCTAAAQLAVQVAGAGKLVAQLSQRPHREVRLAWQLATGLDSVKMSAPSCSQSVLY